MTRITTKYTDLAYPMAVPIKAGLENIKRFQLKAEAGMVNDIKAAGEFTDVLISAHAPSVMNGQRINVAATDATFRRMSIDHILAYIDAARRYPHVRQVNIHFAPKRWVDDTQTAGQESDYDLFVDGFREIAAFAAEHSIEIVMENNTAFWAGISEDVEARDVDWSSRNTYFGVSPEEWSQVCEDVDRPNVGLCLDSSHVCTYAHKFPEEQREARVMAFLAKPHLIRHAHWSDNYLYDTRGRKDSHLVVGKGSLPIELHRGIKYLDATLLLEHFYSAEELEQELEFIDSL
ncbi:sugar phosphate isomerase/epimerase [Dehalococcoidia bacterium]|nr:sugar phosphate isomerase/epimerase [Dehalococcoidia bacterium]